MFWTYELEGAELDQTITGEPYVDHIVRIKSWYREFIQTHLLLIVPLSGASTSQVNVKFSTLHLGLSHSNMIFSSSSCSYPTYTPYQATSTREGALEISP